MPQVINTNIASLNAQRNLNASQSDANVALERLSSGLRINSAKDDAAGLAISERFQSQISGLNMAQRNANDGISLAQTAEGAMDEITNNLQRIRELAVQSANATNSNSDREALNQEVQQRIAEINRIASQTSFNGLKVLDGTFATQTFQVGANTGETISVSGLDSRGSQLGSVIKQTERLGVSVVAEPEPGLTETNASGFNFKGGDLTINGSITINGVEIDASGTYSDLSSLATAVNTVLQDPTNNGITDQADVDAIANISVSTDGDQLVFSSEREDPVESSIELASGSIASKGVTDATATVTSGGGTQSFTIGPDFVFDERTTGNITITGQNSGNPISLDFSSVTDEASFLDAVNNSLSSAGVPSTFEASGYDAATGALTFTNSGTSDIAITDLDLNDGGVPARNFNQELEVKGIQGTTLLDSFASGETTDFEVEINGETFRLENVASLNDIVSQLNAKTQDTGVQANLNSKNDDIIFSSVFGQAFDISIRGDLNADGVFDGPEDLNNTVNATVENDTKNMNTVDISAPEGAELAMISVDYAIDTINGFRAELGAVQNRFESTIANLATTSENLSASNSRIRDADFAAETAELARTQVLQSAGLSVLAQANARPQQVLQLLQG